MLNKFLLFTVLIAVLFLLNCSSTRPDLSENPRPNIVIILADDFGVGDIQAHYPKNKIPTPHLDRLVTEGMSFTDAHSGSAVCTPTRYGLMTGRYSWRTGLQEWVLACYEPPLIASGRLTLPAFLKQQGYHTACIGKWHLGWDWQGEHPSRMMEDKNGLKTEQWDFSGTIPGGPIERGFDYYFGTHVPNFPPFTFIENDHVVYDPTGKYQYDPNEGVVMPKEFEGSPMAPGWKFNQILPAITKRAVDYIHEQSKLKRPFFLYFSMTSPHEPVVPTEQFKGKSGIAPIADFVMETDWSAGQVIQAIEEAGIADNTLLVFTADNGHSHYTGWEELVEAGHKPSGPFRGHKGTIYEGGHRVPFVVRWPGKVKSGVANSQLLCLNDFFSTCAEIFNEELPADAAEDSFSFLRAMISGNAEGLRKSIVNHSVNGEFAYRKGPMKLIFKMPTDNLNTSRNKEAVPHLYNLDEDVAESKDLAKSNPEITRQLSEELSTIVEQGRSTPGLDQDNDCTIDFKIVQSRRWMP